MPESSYIRLQLKRHLGEKQYAKFVSKLPMPGGRTRLLFWQERAWDEFIADNPDCVLTTPEIIAVFADCPEYGAKLRWEEHLRRIASWLTESISREQLEREFGNVERWAMLKEQYQPGDEFYEFRSPPETWQRLAGRAGIALVRDDKVVASFVTILN